MYHNPTEVYASKHETLSSWRHPGTGKRIYVQRDGTFNGMPGATPRFQLWDAAQDTRIVSNLTDDTLRDYLSHYIANGFYCE